jgi:hypothetical protein
VQPIFLKKDRDTPDAWPVTSSESPLRPLAAGVTGWTEQQSRQNFAVSKQFVVPRNPLKRMMLLYPLAEAARGDRFHAGCKHWESQNDPEWQTLAARVRGEVSGGAKSGAR